MNRSQRDAPTLFGVGCLFILLVIAIELWPTLELRRGLSRPLDGSAQWQLAGANISSPADDRTTASPTAAAADRLHDDQSPVSASHRPSSLRWQTPQAANFTLPDNEPDVAADALHQVLARPLPNRVAAADKLPVDLPVAVIGQAAPHHTNDSSAALRTPAGSPPHNRPTLAIPKADRSILSVADRADDDRQLQLPHDFASDIQVAPRLQQPVESSPPAARPAVIPTRYSARSPTSPWPFVPALREQLDLQTAPWPRSWAAQVQQRLNHLQQLEQLDCEASTELIGQLARDVTSAKSAADTLSQQSDQAHLRRAVYALERRVILWREVVRNASSALDEQLLEFAAQLQPERMMEILQSVEQTLQSQPDNWQRFLSTAHVHDVATSSSFHEPTVRIQLATKLLNRVTETDLIDAQKQVMNQPAIVAFRNELRRWVTHPVDLPQLLAHIEEFEVQPTAWRSIPLTAVWNQLRWSLAPAQRQLAQLIDTHYRNANIRFAITEEFLNRLVPAIQNVQAPVCEQILGADVRGQSATRTKFRVNLVPDESQIRIQLEGDGVTSAKTHSTKGGVTLTNRNRARFFVQKMLLMDPRGLKLGQSQSAASGWTNITGLRTRFDTFPIVGSLVRRAAQKQAFEVRDVARNEFESRVAVRARHQLDQKLQEEVANATQRMKARMIDPLEQLGLDPTALAMQTTQDRMTLRGRLASPEQLASFTARPQARSDSLLSIQVHESAMNNFVSQLELEGREGRLEDVVADVAKQAGMSDFKLPEELPEGVKIRLAKTDPFRFRFHDGRIRIDMRVSGLKYGRRVWKNFEVRAHYVPQINGFQCDLYRDDYIELIGSLNSRHQIALRSIFGKVFSKNRPIKLVNHELAKDPRLALLDVSQFVVRDGWVGVSVGQQQQSLATPRNDSPTRR